MLMMILKLVFLDSRIKFSNSMIQNRLSVLCNLDLLSWILNCLTLFLLYRCWIMKNLNTLMLLIFTILYEDPLAIWSYHSIQEFPMPKHLLVLEKAKHFYVLLKESIFWLLFSSTKQEVDQPIYWEDCHFFAPQLSNYSSLYSLQICSHCWHSFYFTILPESWYGYWSLHYVD